MIEYLVMEPAQAVEALARLDVASRKVGGLTKRAFGLSDAAAYLGKHVDPNLVNPLLGAGIGATVGGIGGGLAGAYGRRKKNPWTSALSGALAGGALGGGVGTLYDASQGKGLFGSAPPETDATRAAAAEARKLDAERNRTGRKIVRTIRDISKDPDSPDAGGLPTRVAVGGALGLGWAGTGAARDANILAAQTHANSMRSLQGMQEPNRPFFLQETRSPGAMGRLEGANVNIANVRAGRRPEPGLPYAPPLAGATNTLYRQGYTGLGDRLGRVGGAVDWVRRNRTRVLGGHSDAEAGRLIRRMEGATNAAGQAAFPELEAAMTHGRGLPPAAGAKPPRPGIRAALRFGGPTLVSILYPELRGMLSEALWGPPTPVYAGGAR